MPTSTPAPDRANVAQLAAEIAAAHGWPDATITHPYRPDGTTDGGDITVLRDDADPAKVKAAVQAHVPQAVAPPADLAERLAAVEKELRGMKDRAATEAAKSTTTAKGVAAAIAADSV